MRIGQDGSTGRRDVEGCGLSVFFGLQNGHFLSFALLLGLYDGNVFSGLVKGVANFGLLGVRAQVIVALQLFHQVVDFNPERLLAQFDFPVQKHNVRL